MTQDDDYKTAGKEFYYLDRRDDNLFRSSVYVTPDSISVRTYKTAGSVMRQEFQNEALLTLRRPFAPEQ